MKNTAHSLAALTLALAQAPSAWAQAACSSDGTPRPTAVFERFIHADCEACWTDATTPSPSASGTATVLDWIVPSAAGDDAPLSAAATRDAEHRLQSLGRTLRAGTDFHVGTVEPHPTTRPSSARLRVALGLPFNDYLGTAIEFAPGRNAHPSTAANTAWTYYLVLVEAVPAGTEGTTVPRQIVRNVLQGVWQPHEKRNARSAWARWMEARPMRIPEGAKTERLQMVGWVQDAAGHIVAAAQSVCR
ncbi:hypothetical protein [Acidovorax sp.]|uniref:hypothetical protein n=1 Tax=Acidovorax sp. TaxID=1872122 RepID=UPI00391C7B63